MKLKHLFVIVFSIPLFIACSKQEDLPNGGANSNNTTPPTSTPYHFTFDLDNKNYALRYDKEWFHFAARNMVSSTQVGSNNANPSISLHLIWETKDSVTHHDIIQLEGKTLYFDDSLVRPSLTFHKTNQSAPIQSQKVGDKKYFVKIDDVSFLKQEVQSTSTLNIYIIEGACAAKMKNGNITSNLTTGKFYIRIAINS